MRLSVLTMVTATSLAFGSTDEVNPSSGGTEPEYTTDFRLDHCGLLLPNGGNEYFSLRPGKFLRLEGDDEGEFVEVEVTVLSDVQLIIFQLDETWVIGLTQVVEEREWIDEELVEVSRNYFARCPNSRDVFYFGEDVDIYEDGEIVSHEGAWLAGVDDAKPGLIMPALFLLGARYYQEVAPGVALDRAEHVEMGLTVETPAGTFEDCVKVLETTPLEPDEESIKIYAPGVGLIVDDFLELVEYH